MKVFKSTKRERNIRLCVLAFLAFRCHLHIVVGQPSSSFSSTVCFQSGLSYLFTSSRLLSSHLRLGCPIFSSPLQLCPSIFLRGSLLLLSFSGVHTNFIFSVSRKLQYNCAVLFTEVNRLKYVTLKIANNQSNTIPNLVEM